MATNGYEVYGSKSLTSPVYKSYSYGEEGTSHPRTAPMSSELPREGPNDGSGRRLQRAYTTDQEFSSLPEPLHRFSRDRESSERLRSFPMTESEEKSHSQYSSSRPSPHLSNWGGQDFMSSKPLTSGRDQDNMSSRAYPHASINRDQDRGSLRHSPYLPRSRNQDAMSTQVYPYTSRDRDQDLVSSRASPLVTSGRSQHGIIDQQRRSDHAQNQFSLEENRTTGSSSYASQSYRRQFVGSDVLPGSSYTSQTHGHQISVRSDNLSSTSSGREPFLQASKSKAADNIENVEDSIPRCPSGEICSQATVENARYSLDSPPSSDHPNEDRHFAVEGDNFRVWGVFDGHNGSRAAGFASNYLLKLLHQPFWKNIVNRADSAVICEALSSLFVDTEKEFFANMKKYIEQKKQLQDRIPKNLTSYAAYMQYPIEVQQLQEIEPKLTGGCTAVLAVIINNVLYVANVGDSRALLIRENSKGEMVAEQLSVDHTVENENELKRLEGIGLSPKELIKAGRLGTQENTRSIGDYSIKEGYKDVDSLRSATSPPGTAKPQVMTPITLDSSCKYLVLMTDGVYKTIESTVGPSDLPNDILLHMMLRELRNVRKFDNLSGHVLDRIKEVHVRTYIDSAKNDVRSPAAVACRKRDDMTLIVHKLTRSE